MPRKKEVAPVSPLDAFVGAPDKAARALQLIFWQNRHQNPGFSIEISPEDIRGFEDCVKYLEVTPQIRILRPGGTAPRAAVPAQGDKRAIPGHPGTPPKNYAVVQMVDQDGNTFVPIENNEDDLRVANRAKAAARIRESARYLATQLENDMRQNTFSNDAIGQAIATIRQLAAQ